MTRVSEQLACVQPMVSVAMITYNHEPFIVQAIESVLMQQTDFPVELVVGEDGSTDGTRHLVQEYASRYPNAIRALMHPQNLGARQNALAVTTACRASYVAFLEGDDYWTDPLKLQKQVALLEAKPCYSACIHGALCESTEAGQSKLRWLGHWPRSELTVEDLLRTNPVITCTVVLRRSCLGPLPAAFDSLRMRDWPVMIYAALRGPIAYLSETMGVYRVHENGVWSSLPAHVQTQRTIELFQVLSCELPAPWRNNAEESLWRWHVSLITQAKQAEDAALLGDTLQRLKTDLRQTTIQGRRLFIHALVRALTRFRFEKCQDLTMRMLEEEIGQILSPLDLAFNQEARTTLKRELVKEFLYQGHVCFDNADNENALRFYRRGLRTDPVNPRAWAHYLLQRMGRPGQALRRFLRGMNSDASTTS